MTLCRGTLLGPPPTGHVPRFLDSGVFVSPVGGPSRSLLEVRGAPWVALPALSCSKQQYQITPNNNKRQETTTNNNKP